MEYTTYDDMRFNWRLASRMEHGIKKYYLMHNVNGSIVYVGRRAP